MTGSRVKKNEEIKQLDLEKECTACSGSGYYCGRKCGSCNGTGLEYSKDDKITLLKEKQEAMKREIESRGRQITKLEHDNKLLEIRVKIAFSNAKDLQEQNIKLQEHNARLEHGNIRLTEEIDQLTKERELFRENYKQLLNEAMDLYVQTPHITKRSCAKNFEEEIDFLSTLSTLSKDKEEDS